MKAGDFIDPYRVVSSLGAGGMGEVFRARDTRLNRDVAIKVLPDTFASDPDRLARFEREAQVLASLNHPNIAHVYGIVEGGGDTDARARHPALVMELVDGQDLALRIAQGAIAVDEAIAIAIQIARALEAAHDQGIVHRDLKPANIKLQSDGTAKVLDFGLAKTLDAGGGSEASDPAAFTVTSPALLTSRGVVLGTAAYMSPEQARGKAVDRRSDIWAFGVVLYEMLTGRRMFAAETVSDTIAGVLTRDPALDALPSHTPPSVRRVLQRCLQKDPARRLHHIADARLELEQSSSEPANSTVVPFAPARTRWWPAVALAAVAASAAGAVTWGLLSRSDRPPQRYSLVLPDAGFNTVSDTGISPDGKWIAYSPNRHSGPFALLLRPLDGTEARQITASTNTGYSPFFSEDGQWLAYVIDNNLYRVRVAGGIPERLAPVPNGRIDGAWGDDGTLMLAAGFSFDNVRRPAIGRWHNGTFDLVTRPDPGQAHHDVHILPGSKTMLFTIVTPTTASIAAIPLAGGEAPRVILEDARRPRYARGRLLFTRESGGELMSMAFDPVRLVTSGEATRIASVARIVESTGFDVARDGTIIYSGPADTAAADSFTAVIVSRSGTESTAVAQKGAWAEPRVSPDGLTLILRAIAVPNCELWSVDLRRGTRTRVNLDGDHHNPLWGADGQLTWSMAMADGRAIVTGRIDRPSVPVTKIAPSAHERLPDSWSPAGDVLAFTEIDPEQSQDIWLYDMKSGEARPFLNGPAKESRPRFSRDGKWLAYVTNDSGRDEVYIQPVAGNGARIQVSLEGGGNPLWSPDGRELFFVDEASLMQVEIDLRGARPEIGQQDPRGTVRLGPRRQLRHHAGWTALRVHSPGR
jgi:serine/threonine protein kinase